MLNYMIVYVCCQVTCKFIALKMVSRLNCNLCAQAHQFMFVLFDELEFCDLCSNTFRKRRRVIDADTTEVLSVLFFCDRVRFVFLSGRKVFLPMGRNC